MRTDPRSVAGKTLDVAGETDLLVVGAGPAGLAAALEGARLGMAVTLVDENPVAPETMAENAPQLFGGRMGAATRNRNAMLATLAATTAGLGEAVEAGVEVALGTACFGLYVNRPNLGWMPGALAGLADPEGTRLIRFRRCVVAAGRRDLGLPFPGWEAPGVVGAAAATLLAGRYGAIDGRRAAILGATAEALAAGRALAAVGVEVAVIADVGDGPSGPLGDALAGLGAPILCDEAPLGVETDAAGVVALRLRRARIACDLVVLAAGAAPAAELLDAAGCRLGFDGARGGFAPLLDGQATSIPEILAAGDAAGIWDAKTLDPAIAAAEGRRAARQAAGLAAEPAPPPPVGDVAPARLAWARACAAAAPEATVVCPCEGVTARALIDLAPPGYLEAAAAPGRGVAAGIAGAPPDPEAVKRLTRVGMGPCQGRRCRETAQALLALAAGLPLAAIPRAGWRAPVRPVPLSAFAAEETDPGFAEHWDSWFGMPRQWTPFWEVEPFYTVAGLGEGGERGAE